MIGICPINPCFPASPSVLQQPFETKEQREVEIVEETESQERTTDELVIKRSYKVHMAQEGPVELKVMEELARDIMEREHPELKEQIMEVMKESLTEEILEVNGERMQRVVITKQWTQEVNSVVESQEDMEKVKRHVVMTEGGGLLNMGSEERLKIMERRLQEVEAIEQKLLDVEQLRVGLQEVESLEQRLQRAEWEGLQQAETADWHVLLDCNPSLLTAAPTGMSSVHLPIHFFLNDKVKYIIYVFKCKFQIQQHDYEVKSEKCHSFISAEVELQEIIKPMGRNDDWYILLEMPANAMTLSASSTGIKY